MYSPQSGNPCGQNNVVAQRHNTHSNRWLVVALTMAFALISSTTLSAQTNGSNSPYSRYGFGLLSDNAQGFNKGMSGVAYGMRNGAQLNVKNPASYSAIDSLTFLFDVGFSLQNANLDQGGSKVNAHNSSVDYVTAGFRAAKNLGVSLGMLPYSTIGYSLSSTSNVTSDITQTDTYSGDGGLHEVYLGAGWQPVKFASVGVNAGYLWGEVTNTVLTSFSQSTSSSRRRQYTADIRTYKLDFGLQFYKQIDKNNHFTLGLTYGLGHNIGSRANYYDQTIASSTTSGDTISTKNAYELPHTFGVGLTWTYKGRLRVGLDYNFQKWGSVKTPTLTTAEGKESVYEGKTGSFKDMHKISVGAEYVPNPMGLRWRDHIRYRAGFSYTTPYTVIDGQDGPKDYLVSLGAAIPIANSYSNRSLVNVSLQYERVKSSIANAVSEQYLRICIGLSFNERWFMKWKVE